jgi:hypothetical protein
MRDFDPDGNPTRTVNFTASHTLLLKKLQAFKQVCGIQQLSGFWGALVGADLEKESEPQTTLRKVFTKKHVPQQGGARILMEAGQQVLQSNEPA